MKSVVEESSSLERKLNIEVPVEKVKDIFSQTVMEVKKNVTIDGFRPGKAPLSSVRSKYESHIREDVIKKLINKYFYEALAQHDLKPFNYPEIDFSEFDPDNFFSFSAKFEIHPEIELKEIDGFKVDKEKIEISESDVDKALDHLLQKFVTYEPLIEERASVKGDIVVIDMEIYEGENRLQNSEFTDKLFEVGNSALLKELDEALFNMTAGQEKEVTVNFPEDFKIKDRAGKKLLFKIKLKELKKKVLPLLDDNFARLVSDEFDTLEKLKNNIRLDIQYNEEKRINEDLKKRVLTLLVNQYPFEVPPSLLKSQREDLINDVSAKLKNEGSGPQEIAEYIQKWSDDIDRSALFMVRSSFLINAIAEKNSLTPTHLDVDSRINSILETFGDKSQFAKDYYEREETRSQISFRMMEERVLEFILSKSILNEVPKDQIVELT